MRWLGLGVILNRLVVAAYRVDDTNVEIATTYIFGDYEDIEDLEIGAGVSPGFIELSIDRIRRPSYWPERQSVCTKILSAVIADFVGDIDIVNAVGVMNVSTDLLRACRCYLKVMARLGFEVVNGFAFLSKTDIDSFCGSRSSHEYYIGIRRKSESRRLPKVDFSALLTVALAHTETRIRAIGF